MSERDFRSLGEGDLLKCIRFIPTGKDKGYIFLDIEDNIVKISETVITASVRVGDTFAVLSIKEDGMPLFKKLFSGQTDRIKKVYPKKELAITLYAFAENEVNTAAYKRMDTIDEAVEFFKQLLNKPEITIINVRKLKLKVGEEKGI